MYSYGTVMGQLQVASELPHIYIKKSNSVVTLNLETFMWFTVPVFKKNTLVFLFFSFFFPSFFLIMLCGTCVHVCMFLRLKIKKHSPKNRNEITFAQSNLPLGLQLK